MARLFNIRPVSRGVGFASTSFTNIPIREVSSPLYTGRTGAVSCSDLRMRIIHLGRVLTHATDQGEHMAGGGNWNRGDSGCGLFGGLKSDG